MRDAGASSGHEHLAARIGVPHLRRLTHFSSHGDRRGIKRDAGRPGGTRCGNACASINTQFVCAAGVCGCGSGALVCGGACVDVETDGKNCGACGNDRASKNPQTTCSNGTCQCGAGLANCGATCAYLSIDSKNCGVCGHDCSKVVPGGSAVTCSAGLCQGTVLASQTDSCSTWCSQVYGLECAGGTLTCSGGGYNNSPIPFSAVPQQLCPAGGIGASCTCLNLE
jgi:hypothetical protein